MGAVTTAFVNQFTDNIRQLVQQKVSKLRGTTLVDTKFVGEFKFYDQLGATDMIEKTSRHQDTPSIDPDHQRRRLSKRDFLHNTLFDTEDQLRMIIDPKSAYSMSAAMSAGRQMDDVIIEAFDATAFAGKSGGTSTSFTAANIIAENSEGLTKGKLLNAIQLLDDQDVESEDRFCVCAPTQINDLLDTTEVASSDFNTVKALVQGELNTWLGFQFIKITRLDETSTDSGIRKCWAYHRAAMQLGIGKEPSVRIDQRADKNYAWQVHMSMTINAVRLEEKRITQINCNEA
jgi:hypothetical protein